MEDDSIYQDAGMYANKIREPKSEFFRLQIVNCRSCQFYAFRPNDREGIMCKVVMGISCKVLLAH